MMPRHTILSETATDAPKGVEVFDWQGDVMHRGRLVEGYRLRGSEGVILLVGFADPGAEPDEDHRRLLGPKADAKAARMLDVPSSAWMPVGLDQLFGACRRAVSSYQHQLASVTVEGGSPIVINLQLLSCALVALPSSLREEASMTALPHLSATYPGALVVRALDAMERPHTLAIAMVSGVTRPVPRLESGKLIVA